MHRVTLPSSFSQSTPNPMQGLHPSEEELLFALGDEDDEPAKGVVVEASHYHRGASVASPLLDAPEPRAYNESMREEPSLEIIDDPRTDDANLISV